jgi:NAD(P)-dependent dehydrogenase (short-subunit alcohol dehydrogenase family)
MELKDKIAIVTGSSRGLGKAIAIGLAREGANIVVAARTETDNAKLPGTIYQTAEEIRSLGQQACPVRCDVTDERSVVDMAQQALKQFGHVDILVNNAGIAFYHPVVETPLKRWELVLRVNITGAFLCSREVIPAMIKQGSGSIINISSLAASEESENAAVPTGLAYAVSKAALDRFTRGLAAEVKQHNIAVNALKPRRVVDTEGMRFWMPHADKSEWQSPAKMVRGAILLAAQDASGITGAVATDDELCARQGP